MLSSLLTRLFSILFVSFLLIGCGGGGGGSGGDGDNNARFYTVSFYDSVLDLNGSIKVNVNSPTVNLAELKTKLDLSSALYRASDPTDLADQTSYTISGDTNFYATFDVVEITDQDGLAAINTDATTLSGKYILLNDIELRAKDGENEDEFNQTYGWKPIGYDLSNGFGGIFNGGNHKITNLWIDRPDTDITYIIGLFGYIGNNAQIKNIGVEIAGGKSVRGYSSVGGIAGAVDGGSITNSYSTGAISGTYFVGGIAGAIISSGSITNSYSTGVISGADRVGGIAGVVNNNGSITNSYATGNISGTSTVGGIAGTVDGGSITNGYSTGVISGADNVGGIAGAVYDGSISNSYTTGAISGTYFVG
ncbi:MAG: hypothetical protein LBC09_07430, partial [Helicobacteraceae bacterium]|nr:hypothetical protein [Helicobacteraceae bacterium]